MASTRGSATRWAAGAAGLAFLVGWLAWWWAQPPQMGADAEVFRTVDALFTAVTARDAGRLGQCEQRLRAYRDAGKLPAPAWAHLAGTIRQARTGEWEPAAQRLYAFMSAQRRERMGASRPLPR